MPARELISAQEIAVAVRSLAARIDTYSRGEEFTMLGVLTGSVVFVADLIRHVSTPHQLGFLQASSYRGAATVPSKLNVRTEWLPDVSGQHVWLIDDIFDTGQTLLALRKDLQDRGARSVNTAVLLWKKSRSLPGATPDEFCFEIPDQFVVGYGLDFNGRFRSLPYVGVLDNP